MASDLRVPLGLLCIYGLFKEFRPSEPFLTEYLIDPRWGGLSKDELYSSVYPVYTYATFALVLPVFLFTDYVRYKPIIVLEGLSYIGTWLLLLWAKGVVWMQVMQIVYGIAISTEVSYYTYIYAKTSTNDYLRVSSFTRAAILFGKCSSGLFAQILTLNNFLDYRQLNFVSLGSVSAAFLFSLFLPPVKQSIYFDRVVITPSSENITGGNDPERNAGQNHQRNSFKSVVVHLWNETVKSYSSVYVIKWSFWVIISTCANYQVGNYIQPLWEEIQPSTESDIEIYNGYIESGTALLGALAVFGVGFVKLDWSKYGDLYIVIISLLSGVILFFMGETEYIWFGYIGYAIYRILYQVLMTIASFEIVKKMSSNELDCYALVFGLNMFFALGTQTVLTGVVNDALGLNPRTQFTIYAIMYSVPFVVFASIIIYKLYRGYNYATITE